LVAGGVAISLDLSNVIEAFEPGEEVPVEGQQRSVLRLAVRNRREAIVLVIPCLQTVVAGNSNRRIELRLRLRDGGAARIEGGDLGGEIGTIAHCGVDQLIHFAAEAGGNRQTVEA